MLLQMTTTWCYKQGPPVRAAMGVVSCAARVPPTLGHCCKWVAIDASRSVAMGVVGELGRLGVRGDGGWPGVRARCDEAIQQLQEANRTTGKLIDPAHESAG